MAAAVLAGCAALLILAMWLQPDGRGVGTHEQLGLPPCTMVQFAGIPCPTCGMTTAFSYTVRGRWLSAFKAQPFAFALALSTIALALLAGQAIWSGRTWRINCYRLSPNKVAIGMVACFALAWGFKIVSHLALAP